MCTVLPSGRPGKRVSLFIPPFVVTPSALGAASIAHGGCHGNIHEINRLPAFANGWPLVGANYSRLEELLRFIKERKVEAADDDEIKLKVMELMNRHNETSDYSDPKYLKIIDILDDRGRSLKRE